MINKLYKPVLLITLLLFTLTPVHSVNTSVDKIYSEEIYTLAVSGDNKGVVIKVIFNVYYPGRGLILVVDSSRVSEDTVLSIEYSVIYASILCGVDYRKYDYEFVFPEGTRVKGLSGTLSFILATMSFYNGVKPINKTGATGLVYPNFAVGLVEKIVEKYNAAVEYDLDRVIGPYKGDLLNYTKYYPAVDVFSAYLNYVGEELYNYTEIDPLTYDKHYSIINTVFNESYRNWIYLINNLLSEIKKVVNTTDYSETEAYHLLELSNKYAELNKYYTASTYAFRSYFETYEYYLVKLNEMNIDLLNNIVKELESNITNELKYLSNTLVNYTRRVVDLWDLDAYLNAYVRYYISLKLFAEVFNETLVDKAKIYPIVISRIRTVETWLKLIDYNTENTYLIDWKTYRFATDVLKDYIEKTINYLHYLNILSCEDRESLINILSTSVHRDIHTLVNYTLILFDINMLLNQLSANILTDLLDSNYISYLNKTTYSLMKRVYSETRSLIPSITTTLELCTNYLLENTSLSIILTVYLNEFSVLLPIITVIHVDNIIESMYSREHFVSVKDTVLNVSLTYLLITIIVSIGSFLLGLAIGRFHRLVLKEI